MPAAGGEQLARLLGARSLHVPFLHARDVDSGVEQLESRFALEGRQRPSDHVGRIISDLQF